jgi:hypothetical protein
MYHGPNDLERWMATIGGFATLFVLLLLFL